MAKIPFTIFNNKVTIEINTDMVVEFEKKIGKFKPFTVQRYCEMLGFNETSDVNEMAQGVMTLMKEDFKNFEEITKLLNDKESREALANVKI